jgi:hypothetical protein
MKGQRDTINKREGNHKQSISKRRNKIPPIEKGTERIIRGAKRIWSGTEWYCRHLRRPVQCNECNDTKRGTSKTIHGQPRVWSGSRWHCEHERAIGTCQQCIQIEKGTRRTIHGKTRIWSGTEWNCQHNRRPNQCKRGTCGGASFCPCGIRREQCHNCTTDTKRFGSGRYCSLCGRKQLSIRRMKSGKSACAECDPQVPARWEEIVWNMIKDKLPPPSIRDNRILGGDECRSARTRPDVCWIGTDRIVHLEIDEDSHTDREVACELKKLDSANWGFLDSGTRNAHRPTLTVRFNPNSYDQAKVGIEQRCNLLVHTLQTALTGSIETWDPLRTNVIYLYFHSKALQHIKAAQNAKDSIHVLRIIG